MPIDDLDEKIITITNMEKHFEGVPGTACVGVPTTSAEIIIEQEAEECEIISEIPVEPMSSSTPSFNDFECLDTPGNEGNVEPASSSKKRKNLMELQEMNDDFKKVIMEQNNKIIEMLGEFTASFKLFVEGTLKFQNELIAKLNK